MEFSPHAGSCIFFGHVVVDRPFLAIFSAVLLLGGTSAQNLHFLGQSWTQILETEG